MANPRQVKLISHSSRKGDRIDAETPARPARVDPKLLGRSGTGARKGNGRGWGRFGRR